MSAGISQDPPRLLCCLVGWVGWTHRTSAADRAHTDVAFKISTLLNHQHGIQTRRTQNVAFVHIRREQLLGHLAAPAEVLLGRGDRCLRPLTHPPSHLARIFIFPVLISIPLECTPTLHVSSIYPKPISPGPGMVAQEAEGSL